MHALSSRSSVSGHGTSVNEHMAGREIGDVDAIQESLEGVTYNVWAMKEPNYVIKMMVTHGSLVVDESCRSTIHQWI